MALIKLDGTALIDSGKAPETYIHVVEWVNENQNSAHTNREEFTRRSSAMQALHRLSETAGITFLSYARRSA